MNKNTSVQRFDLGEITSVERTPQGFLKVPGFATRTGVFSYKDRSGQVRRELRHPDDVFAPESLMTLKNAVVTNDHPPVMVTPENFKEYAVGYTTDRVEVNRDLVETDLIISDESAIKAVETDGKRELSCGYLSDLIEESGVYNGTEYDCRQKNIKYNHIAIVDRGRAGPEVRLRLDSADAMMIEDAQPQASMHQAEGENDVEKKDSPALQEQLTRKVVIGGQEVELPAGPASIVEALLDRYDQMRGQLMKLEEDSMKPEEKKDVDVSQKGVSPQVKVEQGAPDGRSAGSKVGAGDKSGAAKAKGDDEEEEKKDEEKEEKKDAQASPIEQLKKDLEEQKGKMDAMQAKLDEYANKSIASTEKKMDSAEVETRARSRAKLERQAEKLVPNSVVEKFDSMSDDEIRASVIKHHRPHADLTGKSTVYLQSRFDSIAEDSVAGEKVRKEMGKTLLNVEKMDTSKEQVSPAEKRRAMIENSKAMWNQPLSAMKK